ncbi:diguanylate cyclase (GGDEF) domain-containing protein [Mariprofundus ferrinatatus]|uniref:diguanylate cyclase n=1 Tax=Mariprofundus ferrinatatus TaxID=1921087 RepID=A0A2K8L2P5_9PROT|nr:diguanylate cyclase [Mariprofundus ferrinatatus]ATX81523.1 diguanylate cyclase (GGDEF) domain-containing protein [Mariprofundus ferrinatatus]
MDRRTPSFRIFRYAAFYCKAALLCLCLIAGLFISIQAQAAATLQLQASEPIYSLGDRVEYLEDRDGTLEISTILNEPEQTWQKHSADIPSFGFSNSAFWFRLTITADKTEERLLDISHPLLDEVSLYLLSKGHLIRQFHTGDLRLYKDRPLNHLGFVFPVTLEAQKPLTLYLRVKSAGSVQVPMKLWSETAFHDSDEVVMSAIGIYFGVIISLILYNLFLYLRVFEPAYIYYVLYVMMFGLFIAGLTGWGYKFLWPEAVGFQQYGLAIFICMGSVFVCRFVHYFLDLPKNAPRVGKLLVTAVLLLLGMLAALPFTSYHIVVQMALAMTIIISTTSLYVGVMLWRKGEVMARYFTIAWAAFLVAVILAILEKFAILPRTFLAEGVLPLGMALEVILLSMALGERINSEKQQRIQAQEHIIVVQEKHQLELEQKVEERTIELEKANAQLHLLATTDGLTGIFNRRHFLERGTHDIKVARRYKRPIAMIMLDIDHFKQVNDTYGHDAGDQAIRHLVGICNALKRETDLIGRLGGEEFGILLLETSAESACEIAERLRQEIENSPLDYEGAEIRYTISQGVCTVSGDAQKLAIEEILKIADKALYEAKESGRNRVVSVPGKK